MLKQGPPAARVAAQHGVVPEQIYQHALNGFAAVIPPAALKRLQADPNVAWTEPDQIAFASGKPSGAGPKNPPTVPLQETPPGIRRVGESWGIVNADIAIIDTGIDLSHKDLNVVSNITFVRRSKSGNDDNGHGTHVAGIAAALDNAIGVKGVAPGARLWAVKVLDRNGSGAYSDVIKGIDYVAENAADIEVANLSLGGPNSDALNSAIHNAVGRGVVFVAAAGNEAADASYSSPANSYDVLCASAIADTDGEPGGWGPSTYYAADDWFASFSNFGSVVDIAAPGVDVYSTYKGDSYATLSGTSMAAPHVAGGVARLLAVTPKPTSNDATVLRAFVHDIRAAMLLETIPQTDPDGFKGDPDEYAEPLLNVRNY